ncbi:ankyrin repeat domain-containing protein [Streptomyces sp. P11-1]|uniref:ankyrin repeat domain-containing protein n=1 Tax=Streptomyces sp. P11-1 TaxID=3423221 RepID=UPI003D2ED75B
MTDIKGILLVNSEAPWTADEIERWTPAHQAVEMSDYETLTVLLDAGADPNEVCFGHTLLTHAIDIEGDSHLQSGHPLNTAATAILQAYGADPRLPAEDGETPLQVAQHYDHALAERLLQRLLTSPTGPEAQGKGEDQL